ncbi:hypothetical protein ACP2AV_00835 [Aliiroseovarius sp. PTFE2010]|uniref:hypothetical protein n=1 Tax=Aliiroseovarius sp. PTFE2010 TaxID=3417190 RepID=UPI003CEC35A9
MKKLALAAALAAFGTAAVAGGYDAPIIEAPVIVEETAGSSAGGVIVPLLILALVAAAIASN